MQTISVQPSVVDLSRRLQSRWARLLTEYLPIRSSIWSYSRTQSRHDPPQGWKIHVSSTVLTAGNMLSTIGPLLKGSNALYKAPASLDILMQINSGVVYPYSQIGKTITVYPRDESEFTKLVEMLDPLLTIWRSHPAIPFDLRYKRTCIYYRYGAFRSRNGSKSDGSIPSINSPDGTEVPDPRNMVSTEYAWLKDPFTTPSRSPYENRRSKLSSRYLVYRALSQRGKGGVYECLDVLEKPPRQYVLKEGRKNGETTWDGRDGLSRIRNEARVLASLADTRANVPRIYDRFIADSNQYLVIERIDGINLRTLIQRGAHRMSLNDSLDLCLQLCEIVAAVHGKGWVWRDCKPENFVIDIKGTVRAIDFEGACRFDKPDPLPWSTHPYTPPEEATAIFQPGSQKQDLFALGVSLFELLEGKLPASKQGRNGAKIRRLGVSIRIKDLISQLLSHDPRKRPEAEIIAELLRQFLSQTPDGFMWNVLFQSHRT